MTDAGRRQDRLIAWALFAAAFAALLSTEGAIGFPRDESVYFEAGERYARWYQQLFRNPSEALSDRAIAASFQYNAEHPALMKTLFGLSYLLFHEGLGLLRPATAFRLPALLVAALIAPLLFLFGRGLFGRAAGLFAAASFFLVPRQFFNSHLACFDVPVATFWLLTVYAFWRAQAERRWWLWCGVAFGLALATKHNALFLPFVLGPFALWRADRASKSSPEARALFHRLAGLFAAVVLLYGVLLLSLGPRFQEKFLLLSPHTALFGVLVAGSASLLWRLSRAHEETFRALSPIAAMAVLGPLVFYLHWPYLWHAPVDRTGWWLAFHARHEHYTWFYLGKLLRQPPFPLEYVLVKTALTVPLSLFLPMALGLFSVAARAVLSRWPKVGAEVRAVSWAEALVVVNALASIAIISHPQVPHFGGVKHWFPSMPFLGLLAGYSVARAGSTLWERLKALRPALPSWAVLAPLSSLLLLPPLIATARVHPYGTAYYSELAGGLPGAATLGMQRQFWSSHVTGVLDWINQNAPPGARVWLHEVRFESFRDYQRNGMLRKDLAPARGPADAQIAAYQYHQEFKEHEVNVWHAFGTRRPVTGLYLDETPQIVVYRRP